MPSNNLTPSTDDFTNIDAEAPAPNVDTSDERRIARISKSKQWKQIVEYIELRKTAYRQYLPGVNPAISGGTEDWKVADCVVKELTALTDFVDEITTGVISKD